MFGGYKQGEVGEYISILYDAKNPDIIFIDRFGYLWGYFIFFGTIGLIFVAGGILIYRKEPKIL